MFGLFKKKTEREKLMDLYKKKKEEAFNISKIDRKKGDQLEIVAHDISVKIDAIDSKK